MTELLLPGSTDWRADADPSASSARPDAKLVGRLAHAVGERLASADVARGAGAARWSADDRRQLTARLVSAELDDLAADRLASGEDPLTADGEATLFAAVVAEVQGIGRVQPLLDDPDVSATSTSAAATRRG